MTDQTESPVERSQYYKAEDFQSEPPKEEIFEGDERGLRQAARAAREQNPPIIERSVDNLPETLKLNEAADILKFTHGMERGAKSLAEGRNLLEATADGLNDEGPIHEIFYQDAQGKPILEGEPKTLQQAKNDLLAACDLKRTAPARGVGAEVDARK